MTLRFACRRTGKLLLTLGLATVSLAKAVSACQLAGEVYAGGQPLAGVELSFQALLESPVILGRSGGDGGFDFTVEPVAPNIDRVSVQFSKSGFETVTQLLRAREGDRCPLLPVTRVSLAREQGVAPAASIHGRTIYIAPFELFHEGGDEDAARLNRIFDRVLNHRILAFVTGLQLDEPPEDISILRLEEPLSMANSEDVRRLGSELQALGIIGGDGEARDGAEGEKVIDLWSEFRIIPVHRDFRENRFIIGDTIPSGHVSPRRIGLELKNYWGQKAMIALAVRQLSDSQNRPSREILLQHYKRLNAVRKTMGEDDPLLSEIESLMNTITEELAP